MQSFFFIFKFFYVFGYNLYLIFETKALLYLNLISTWDHVENSLYFYIYFIIVLSSISMLVTKNPIHSVFFLILVFIHVGFLLLMLNVEFLAFLLFIVYLGAIAVLFLFVIMMFNIQILESRDNIIRYIPLVLIIMFIIIEMCYLGDLFKIKSVPFDFMHTNYLHKSWFTLLNNKENIIVLSIIYNYYFYNFILASLILFVGMLGAIVLTLNPTSDLKKQIYYKQNSKTLYNSLSLKNKNKQFKLEIWEIFKLK